jgi:hypothetical protein
MANALYRKGAEKFGDVGSSLALLTDTIKAAILSSAYTPNLDTHEFYSDISAAVLGTPQTLGTKSFTLGVFDAADPTWPAVPGGSTATYVAIYKDTGVAGTSPLIALLDTITGWPLATNGGNIQVVWDNGANKIFKL